MMPIIADDPEAMAALRLLLEKGYTPDQIVAALADEIDPIDEGADDVFAGDPE